MSEQERSADARRAMPGTPNIQNYPPKSEQKETDRPPPAGLEGRAGIAEAG